MKKYIFALWLVLASAGFVFAGPPCIPPIPESGSPTYLTIDLTGVTDTNIPYMQAAGAGFGDSPLSTDGTSVTSSGNLGITKADPAIVFTPATATDTRYWMGVTEDAGGDDDDKFQIGDGATPGTNPFVTVLTDGKVGIGTDAPAMPLDVNGRIYSRTGGVFADNFQTYTGGATLFQIQGGTTGDIAFTTGGSERVRFLSTGLVGIGTSSPDTRLHAEIDDATTNATTNVQTLTHTTTGTPAANIGAGLVFETETAAGNNEKVAVIEGIASELATPGAEDGALVFKTMTAGAAATEKMRVTEYALATQARTVKKTNVSDANYGTSALTSDYIIAFTSLSAARTATISTEDEDTGTTTQPRVMIFKDESGSAATYNITISLESGGTIDGAANFVIDQPYQSVTIYLNGTNGYIY